MAVANTSLLCETVCFLTESGAKPANLTLSSHLEARRTGTCEFQPILTNVLLRNPTERRATVRLVPLHWVGVGGPTWVARTSKSNHQSMLVGVVTPYIHLSVACEPVWPSGKALCRYKQKDFGSIRFGSPFSSKIVVYGHCLVTLPTQLMKHENGSHNCQR